MSRRSDGAHRVGSWSDRYDGRRGPRGVRVVSRGHGRGRQGQAERRADHDRRPDGRGHVGHDSHPARAGGPRHDLQPLVRVLSAVLPVARHDPDRALQPQPRRAGQPAAAGRLRAPRQGQHPARLAPAARLHHHPHRQVPERLRPRRAGRRAARVDRVARVGRPLDLPDVGIHAERERDAADLRPSQRAGPGALPARRLPREGRGLHPPPLGPRQALLPVRGIPGPAHGGPRTAGRPGATRARRRATAAGSPTSRCLVRPRSTRRT